MNNTNLANYLIYLHVSLVFSRIFLIINFEHECHEFDELIYGGFYKFCLYVASFRDAALL